MNLGSPGTYPKACPRCRGDLVRIRRRPLDRLLSLFRPVHRCACAECGWSGRMRATGLDRYSTIVNGQRYGRR